MLRIFRWPIRILTAVLFIFILYINIRLYDQPLCITVPGGQINCETLDQLHYLRRILHEEGAAEEMEGLYPEGFVFTYATYALAWCEVAAALPPVFAQQQYENYRKHFVTYRMGLPGIREYADHTPGLGDIDSGPVIMGVGGAASIVGIRAAALNADWQLCIPLGHTIKSLLLPRTAGKERSYLFGQLPIIDAFMAWSNAGNCLANTVNTHWRWKFQLISLCLLLTLALVFYKSR